MASILNDIPYIKSVQYNMEAVYYNQVCLALARFQNPLRLELINLRGMDIVIDDEAWMCVDRVMGGLPTMAWTGFERSKRSALYEPVSCELRLYHRHAELVSDNVLDIVYRHLSKKLQKPIKSSARSIHIFANSQS